MTSAVALALFVLLPFVLAPSWGPGHHLEFAERTLRRRRELLPAKVARLISEHRPAFSYGNIAADIINFKAWGGEYNHCHRWGVIDEMREQATTPRQESFILGYLTHLAADTIAHNHFVPYHVARFALTRGLGHLYWELSADRFIAERRWLVINQLKNQPALDELDELVNAAVPRKALSMRTNKLIFNHVLLVSERDQWRRAMGRLHPRQRIALKKGFLANFQRAVMGRIRLALHPRGFARIQEYDPNGKLAQRRALGRRERVLHRLAPGSMRRAESERIAAPFLEGMETPKP
ncbi:MAG: zinc dependent phospholipase C family protein [Planctomycetota bacterium]|jgi:hypothetical protein|nr:zinc dependent phospholipase C family protein [Planctomycetota bacterium]MDP6763279.1 zinc dependent phospholipase C family protein [Planctomycetota bacterium]MDP6988039.1 zinc dependent phospholipase C family protein [Planctomycetota bacterium]